MSHFIPEFHFDNPDTKLTPEWCMKVVDYHYYNSDNRNLLDGKNVKEIDDFSSGNFDMTPFKRIFKSLQKAANQAPRTVDGQIDQSYDKTGISWEPLPLIPQKLNSAAATAIKVPIEVECKAQDALAMKKRQEDIDFLINKPIIEADLQDIADQMDIGKVDIGTTKNSSREYSSSPLGLDLADSDQKDLFATVIYSLRVETAFEKGLQQFYDNKRGDTTRLLEIMDQYKYGVSVNRGFSGAITGLPDLEYVYPGDVRTPISRLPDYSDNTHRIIDQQCTVMELFNYFGDEICDLDKLNEIMNNTDKTKHTGYCYCSGNGGRAVGEKNWGTFKVQLKYIEVKSVDWIGVVEKEKSKRGVKYFTNDEKKCTRKIWAQNTYGFWWLANTKHVFGIHRLKYSYRTKGQESYQNFSTNIYRSQKKSAVELSISENKKAQIADIKLQHALIKSKPAGSYIDLRFMRGAISGLKNSANKWTMDELVTNFFENNNFIADTEGFEGKNDGQLKPWMDIPGGLKSEVAGYIQTILAADQNIAGFTGINPQLTGQSANPEGLVGLQKLLINSSINALHYVNIAMKSQYIPLFNIWASEIKTAIEAGGKTKAGMVAYIGQNDADIIDGLDDVPIHNLTLKVEIGQREEERLEYEQQKLLLKQKGVLTTADEYILSGIKNTKDRIRLLAIKENKWNKDQEKIRMEQFANTQLLMRQQGENMMQTKAAENQGKIEQIYAKGDVESKILTLGNQLGMTQKQIDALIERSLTNNRNEGQMNKGLRLLQEKKQLENQDPIN